MKIFVCTRCGKKQACTLFYPDEDRDPGTILMPSMCGPDEFGYILQADFKEAPENSVVDPMTGIKF